MEGNDKVIIENVIEVEQPMGRFLIGVLKASELLKITHKNPRRYNEELDSYVGIQREIDQKKIDQLKKFVKTNDSTFPNSIIGTLNTDNFDYDEENKVLKIKKDPNSFAVIDGQHRLASFEDEEAISKNFDIIVAFFLGLDLEEQAYLFSVINMTQKKLNPSLVQDLTELFTITTPEKLAHNLAKIFNTEKNSPWYRKIKMLGKDEAKYKGTISQYTFTKAIVDLIADKKTYYEIRDILKTNKNKRLDLSSIKINEDKFVLWNYYISEKDNLIFKLLRAYFKVISNEFKDEWGSHNHILTKTTGYNAFMKWLRDLCNLCKNKEDLIKEEFYRQYIAQVKPTLAPLTSENYPPGQNGEKKLYDKLLNSIENEN